MDRPHKLLVVLLRLLESRPPLTDYPCAGVPFLLSRQDNRRRIDTSVLVIISRIFDAAVVVDAAAAADAVFAIVAIVKKDDLNHSNSRQPSASSFSPRGHIVHQRTSTKPRESGRTRAIGPYSANIPPPHLLETDR